MVRRIGKARFGKPKNATRVGSAKLKIQKKRKKKYKPPRKLYDKRKIA